MSLYDSKTTVKQHTTCGTVYWSWLDDTKTNLRDVVLYTKRVYDVVLYTKRVYMTVKQPTRCGTVY